MRFNAKKIISGFLTLVLIGAAVTAVFFRQEAYDWWRLRSYEPEADIVALADDTAMTDEARQIFYVTHPDVTDAETFNQNCHIEEFSIILGCYISRGNIYIYDVADKRLEGIHEVTAAHEMLHAAYERLDDERRAELDSLLVETYKAIDDTRLNDTIAQYMAADPSSVPNELHSILGTEFRELPDALEQYYSQYFKDRKKVVSLSEKYERVFSSRQIRVAQLDNRLSGLKTEIDFNQQRLAELNVELSQKKQELDSLRSSGQFSQYNALVDSYNEQVNEYNELVDATKAQISEYNDLVEERNSLATEVQDLVEAIDSTPKQIQ